ncbi:hypothetical protein NDU88_005419 [Pleurodeles waltl]|uniref:Uncharacterized protein n=1 Tax=Pleurodeles waltl TaxID=8319 RepID=A0AAV7UI19_PLEWA|nr:hypothetical protein NDU88_005419 [Pleurodeles waltl]
MESPCRLWHLRECRNAADSSLSHHNFRKLMAMQHAHGVRSGKLLAWLFREELHSAPIVVLRLDDSTMATSQLATNDAYCAYYHELYM